MLQISRPPSSILIQLNPIYLTDPLYLSHWVSHWAAELYRGLQTRYPGRKLIPFATRSDCDDTACFEIGKGGTVQLIHDFAGPGREQRQEFPDCWAWLAQAVNDMIEYNRECGIV